MRILVADADSLGNDIDWSAYEAYGEIIKYGSIRDQDLNDKLQDIDVLIVNKTRVNESTIGKANALKLVCITATGTDNLDKEYLEKKKIAWRNVAGYSTESVAQHTFAMLFYLLEHLHYYDSYVKQGNYINDKMFTHFDRTFPQLAELTYGIIGLGAIGSRVAEIATAFGAHVIFYSPSGSKRDTLYEQVSLEELLKRSDIVSVHAPLTDRTRGLMNREAFQKMKSSAILINVGRGPIVREQDLLEALESGEIQAAGLDVLEVEPMSENNPLIKIQDSSKLLITPHIAWASKGARKRLMEYVLQNIKDFFDEN